MYGYTLYKYILINTINTNNARLVLQGYHGKREYIAAQGPLPCTVDQFWRMLWEKRVNMIVMLTKLIENGKVIIVKHYSNF